MHTGVTSFSIRQPLRTFLSDLVEDLREQARVSEQSYDATGAMTTSVSGKQRLKFTRD